MGDITKNYILFSAQILVVIIALIFSFYELSLIKLKEPKIQDIISIEALRWTIVGVTITVLTHIVSEFIKTMILLFKQESILKFILSDAYFLTKTGGHIEYFRNGINAGKCPDHDMRGIDVSFYWNNLNNKVNGKPTFPLKHLLAHTNDKIVLINNYRKNLRTWARKMDFIIRKVIPELENKLNKIREEINCEFKVCLTKEEKSKIDDLVNR